MGSDKTHTVIMSKEDYLIFLDRHTNTAVSDEDAGKRFNISICPESKSHAQLRVLVEKAGLINLHALKEVLFEKAGLVLD